MSLRSQIPGLLSPERLLATPSTQRLYEGASGSVSADGSASFIFGPVPQGFVWEGTVSIAGAPNAATFTAKVAATDWGTWNGGSASPLIQAWPGETITVVAAGLVPAGSALQAGAGVGQFGALLTGRIDTEQTAQPKGPEATASPFQARHLGDFDIAAGLASGSFTVGGLQPSDHYLMLVVDGSPMCGTVESTSSALIYGTFFATAQTYDVLSVPALFDTSVMVVWQLPAQVLTPSSSSTVSVYATPVEPAQPRKVVRASSLTGDVAVGDYDLIGAAFVRLVAVSFAVSGTGVGVGGGNLKVRNAFTNTLEQLAGVACEGTGEANLYVDLGGYVASGAFPIIFPAASWSVTATLGTADIHLLYENLQAA